MRKLIALGWIALNFSLAVVLVVVIIAFAVLMGGCASVTDYQWVKRHDPLPYIAIALRDDVDAACREQHAVLAGRITGCAVRDYRSQICIIYLPKGYPQWLEDHERRHCLTGEDHL